MPRKPCKTLSPKEPPLKGIELPPSLREKAHEAVKRAILDGTLAPGEIYTEGALAKVLGISRTPVHEALLDLETRGFVTLLPRKGVRVNTLRSEDIGNLYQFRRVIEGEIMRKQAERVKEQDLARLREIHQKALEATDKGDHLAYVRADREFHLALALLSRNPYMVEALENVRDLVDWMGLRALLRDERIYEVNQEHEHIIRMLEARDVDRAVEAVVRHAEITRDNVLAAMEPLQAATSNDEPETRKGELP